MKILVVSSVVTHPVRAGNQARMASLCEALEERGHEVHFAWIPHESNDPGSTPERFPGRFIKLNPGRFPPRDHTLGGLARRISRRLGMPWADVWGIDDWCDPILGDQVRAIHEKERFGAVVVSYVFYSAILLALGPDVMKVIETHDRFANRHLLYRQAGIKPEWFSTTTAEETRGLSRADVVIAIQEDEADEFRREMPSATRVVAVHPFNRVEAVPCRAATPTAIAVASGNVVNIQGLRSFVEEVLPKIRQEVPAFELVVAGSAGASLNGMAGVRTLGRIDDLRDAYSQGWISVNPVRFGTGFCIKSLEALSFGVPLVTTHSGRRGLPDRADAGYLEVPDDDPEAMAKTIVDWIRSPDLALERDRAARFASSWAIEQKRRLAQVFDRDIGSTRQGSQA